MKTKITDVVRQLGETYGIDEKDVIPIVESTIRESIISYYGLDADVHCEDGGFKIYAYNSEAEPVKLDLNRAGKKFVAFLKRRLTERFQIEKALSDYNAVRHLQGNLVGGYLLEKHHNYCLIKLNDTPFETKNVLPLRYKIPREALKFNEHCFFIVSKIRIERNSGKFELVVYLSRTSKKLPELLLQKAVEEKTGVNIDCRCTKRVSGVYSILETKVRVPGEIVSFVRENLNGERIILKRL